MSPPAHFSASDAEHHPVEAFAESETSSQDGDEAVQSEEEGARDLEILTPVSSGPVYSVFSPGMKRWIVAMNCISAFISPTTANIYFPAIPTLAESLGVSISKINLTITTYMIFQGLAPMVFGDFGDAAGRRPAFIIALTIYLGANIGLALQRDYASLLVLRMLQSSGSSGTLALVYAVVADIAPSSERGKYMGIVGAGITIGPALGPVLGGLINAYAGWPWIFFFLIIITGVWLIPYILTVPETARKVVGNGSIPPQGWNMTLIDYVRFRNQPRNRSTAPRREIPIPNPINTLKVLGNKNMAMILLYNAALFICTVTVTATISTQFKQIYGYSDVLLGLLYLPIGGSTAIASIGGGFVADWNFRRISKKMGLKIDHKRGTNLADFPIEKARIQLIYPLIVIGGAATIGYGWSLERQVHVAAPLIFTFLIGLCVSGPFSIMNILIVDSYPQAPATATAANNLCRCLLGAGATAAIEPLIDAIGRGWAFTLVALVILVPSPVLWLIAERGPKWRREKLEEIRKQAKERDAVHRQQAALPIADNEKAK
ncbi:chloramphenicol resistance protein [Xylariaceae sp. FL0255]|nr:chloramphenicol resistance protein [Xylariaceae sp. FL0255]